MCWAQGEVVNQVNSADECSLRRCGEELPAGNYQSRLNSNIY